MNTTHSYSILTPLVAPTALVLTLLFTATAAAGCNEEPKSEAAAAESAEAIPAEGALTPTGGGWSGIVKETIDSGGYTYIQLDTGRGTLWAAAPEFEINVGAQVTIPAGLAMENYHSKTLNRTFDVVYFVDKVKVGAVGKRAAALPPGMAHPPVGAEAAKAAKTMDYSGLSKPEGGHTVAEIFAGKKELTGKEVTFRGKVVRFNPQIMGVNWLHVRDGTGAEGSNDLTVTTADLAAQGDTVLVKGTLAADRDFGHGYKYSLIVEGARVTLEASAAASCGDPSTCGE